MRLALSIAIRVASNVWWMFGFVHVAWCFNKAVTYQTESCKHKSYVLRVSFLMVVAAFKTQIWDSISTTGFRRFMIITWSLLRCLRVTTQTPKNHQNIGLLTLSRPMNFWWDLSQRTWGNVYKFLHTVYNLTLSQALCCLRRIGDSFTNVPFASDHRHMTVSIALVALSFFCITGTLRYFVKSRIDHWKAVLETYAAQNFQSAVLPAHDHHGNQRGTPSRYYQLAPLPAWSALFRPTRPLRQAVKG